MSSSLPRPRSNGARGVVVAVVVVAVVIALLALVSFARPSTASTGPD